MELSAKSPVDIRHVKDPIEREIYAMGYTEIYYDHCSQELILYGPNQEKRLKKSDVFRHNFTIMRGVLPDVEIHEWVKEGDGSCERLRKIIAP